MLATKTIPLFGLEIPYYERITVAEREALEVLSVSSAEQKMAESRQFYEAVRVIVKERMKRELPPYGSDPFRDTYAPQLEEAYTEFFEGVTDLLEPFTLEQAEKKAIRVRRSLEKTKDAKALRALAKATQQVADTYNAAAERLERLGTPPSEP